MQSPLNECLFQPLYHLLFLRLQPFTINFHRFLCYFTCSNSLEQTHPISLHKEHCRMTVCKCHSTGMHSIGQSQLRICIQINIPVRDICTEGVFICVDFAPKMRVESLIRSYQLVPPDFVFTFWCWQKTSNINQ